MRTILGIVSTTLGLVTFLHSSALAVELRSINDIPGGTTLDFENQCIINQFPRCHPNQVLSPFNIESSSSASTTTFVNWVIGNNDAPISNGAVFVSDNHIKLKTTAQPWQAIGFSAVGTVAGEKRDFELRAFDINNNLLGSITTTFDASSLTNLSNQSEQQVYNNEAKFLGWASSTPIYSIDFLTSNPNTALDNLTFTTATTINTVPEPATIFGLATVLGFGVLLKRESSKKKNKS